MKHSETILVNFEITFFHRLLTKFPGFRSKTEIPGLLSVF